GQGGLEGHEVVAVGPGDVVRRQLVLAAGKLLLESRLTAATAADDAVSYRIEPLDAPDPQVMTTSRATPSLLLASGRYRVEARSHLGNAGAVREIDLKAGQTLKLTLEFAAASLRLRLAGAASEAFRVVRDEAGHAVWATGQQEPAGKLAAAGAAIGPKPKENHYGRVADARPGKPRLLELGND